MGAVLFYILCGFSRQLFDPFEAVCPNCRSCALEELVAVQAEQHRCGRPMKDERAEEGEGEHDAPDADQVVDKDKSGVTATAHDADIDRHLIGSTHARDAEHQEKVFGNGVGFGGEIIKIQNEGADDKQRHARDQADAQENDLHRFDVFAQLGHIALADRFADDDRRC